MPTLNWIGKDKIINHHQEVPYKVLNHEYGFSENVKTETPIDSGNSIINGDNLEALKSLLPKYEGKVNCIYIDPPYNTGNESWVYNDNVNSPKIKKWLGKVVGKESEDLTRHDKWLCMMYPRLKLLHKLLSKDGAIFISIDDNEQANLKLMMDEIFGSGNFRNLLYSRRYDKNLSLQFLDKGLKSLSVGLEHILVYAKSNTTVFNPVFKETDEKRSTVGYWKGFWNDADRPTMRYDILGFTPDTGQWKWKEETGIEAVQNYQIFITDYSRTMSLEEYWSETGKEKKFVRKKSNGKGKNLGVEHWIPPSEGILRSSNWSDIITTAGSDRQGIEFNNPKNVSLIEEIIKFCSCDKNSIILDSFAGSGTTAHAVLNLNKQDGGNRKFILIEMENYAETITAERVKRVIKGYADKEATGGSFDYYTLGEPLFDENNNLNETVGIEKIREYVWFTETRIPYTIQELASPFLGIYNDTSYYFIYEKENLTTLDYESLAEYVKQRAERYIIYADNCLLPETFMRAKNIEFKKIPRDITRF